MQGSPVVFYKIPCALSRHLLCQQGMRPLRTRPAKPLEPRGGHEALTDCVLGSVRSVVLTCQPGLPARGGTGVEGCYRRL